MPAWVMQRGQGAERPLQSGFTLIEILLVITLIAVSVAMVAPSFISMSGGDLDEEARRLQKALRFASEEAQLTGVPLRLSLLKEKYRFETLSADEQWQATSEPPFQPYTLPQEIEAVELRFADSFVAAKAQSLDATAEENVGIIGRLVFWPDGMLDAADLVLAMREGDRKIVLQARSGPGGIRISDEGSQ